MAVPDRSQARRRADLARHEPPGYTGRMNGRKRASLLQQAEKVECRRCGVVCEKVVYPSACLAQGCPFLYAYQAFDRTYVGCTQNVFAVDIDLELLERASRRRNGFGAIKAGRPPLEICPAGVEKAYEHRDEPLGCVNPEFHELPARPSFRVIATRPRAR
jgi:hypothetical protein